MKNMTGFKLMITIEYMKTVKIPAQANCTSVLPYSYLLVLTHMPV